MTVCRMGHPACLLLRQLLGIKHTTRPGHYLVTESAIEDENSLRGHENAIHQIGRPAKLDEPQASQAHDSFTCQQLFRVPSPIQRKRYIDSSQPALQTALLQHCMTTPGNDFSMMALGTSLCLVADACRCQVCGIKIL